MILMGGLLYRPELQFLAPMVHNFILKHYIWIRFSCNQNVDFNFCLFALILQWLIQVRVKLQNQGHFWNLHWMGCRKMSSYCFQDLLSAEKLRIKKRKQFCGTPCTLIFFENLFYHTNHTTSYDTGCPAALFTLFDS